MKFELKTLSPEAVPRALAKAERYRLLNEPGEAESIIYERRAKAHVQHGAPRAGPRAYEWLREAMTWYEKAETIRQPGNDDALLRWNACARLIMRDHHLVPVVEEPHEPILLE